LLLIFWGTIAAKHSGRKHWMRVPVFTVADYILNESLLCRHISGKLSGLYAGVKVSRGHSGCKIIVFHSRNAPGLL